MPSSRTSTPRKGAAAASSSFTDTWGDSASASTSKEGGLLLTPPSTPSTRATRSAGKGSMYTYHQFFTRQSSNTSPASRQRGAAPTTTTRYAVGESVIISRAYAGRQNFLRSPTRNLGSDAEDARLDKGENVGLITHLFDDPAGIMHARINWFVFAKDYEGTDDLVPDPHVNDLYYVTDSSHYRERALSCSRPGTPSRRAIPTYLSDSHSSDDIPLKLISRHAQLLAPASTSDDDDDDNSSKSPTFNVIGWYDARPTSSSRAATASETQWYGPLDWSKHATRAEKATNSTAPGTPTLSSALPSGGAGTNNNIKLRAATHPDSAWEFLSPIALELATVPAASTTTASSSKMHRERKSKCDDDPFADNTKKPKRSGTSSTLRSQRKARDAPLGEAEDENATSTPVSGRRRKSTHSNAAAAAANVDADSDESCSPTAKRSTATSSSSSSAGSNKCSTTDNAATALSSSQRARRYFAQLQSDEEDDQDEDEDEEDGEEEEADESDASDGEASNYESEEEDDEDDDEEASVMASDDEDAPRSDDDEDEDMVDDYGTTTPSNRKRRRASGYTPRRSGGSSSAKKRRRQRGLDSDDDDDELSAAQRRAQEEALRQRREATKRRREARKKAAGGNFRLPERATTSSAQINGDAIQDLPDWDKARVLLHVGATPKHLPGREAQSAELEFALADAIDNSTGMCLYISGVPGTGKTATVYSVLHSLQVEAEAGHIKPFNFLEINGMKISEPTQAFTKLWESLSDGQRAAPKQALAKIDDFYRTPDPRRKTTVLLVDELDQMMTRKQEVIYNLFNWPHMPNSQLVVIAIANTMNLPEQEFSGKICSRLGSNRFNFAPYSKPELLQILEHRLQGLDVMESNAKMWAAAKTASVMGDCRRMLDLCRRAIERVDQRTKAQQDGAQAKQVGVPDVIAVYKEMTEYGPLPFVKSLSLYQKILLYAVVHLAKKRGSDDIDASELIRYHLDFCRMQGLGPPSHEDIFASIATLHAMHLVTAESQRLDYFQRVRSLVHAPDVIGALKEDAKMKHYIGGASHDVSEHML